MRSTMLTGTSSSCWSTVSSTAVDERRVLAVEVCVAHQDAERLILLFGDACHDREGLTGVLLMESTDRSVRVLPAVVLFRDQHGHAGEHSNRCCSGGEAGSGRQRHAERFIHNGVFEFDDGRFEDVRRRV
jgi:hypothetical protein